MSLRKLRQLCEQINENVGDDMIAQATAEVKRRAKSYTDLIDLEKEMKDKYHLTDRQWLQVLQSYEYGT